MDWCKGNVAGNLDISWGERENPDFSGEDFPVKTHPLRSFFMTDLLDEAFQGFRRLFLTMIQEFKGSNHGFNGDSMGLNGI